MKKLTPRQLVLIRQKLSPVAELYNLDIEELIKTYKAKNIEFKGLIGMGAIIKLIAANLATDTGKEVEEIKENIEEEEQKTKKEVKKVSTISKDFWDEVEIEQSSYTPFLKIQNGLVYTFDLLSDEGRYHRDKTYQRDQWVWQIKLTGITPKKALQEENKEGFALYVIDKEYSLALAKKAMQRFKELFIANDYEIDSVIMERKGKSFQTDYIFKLG